MQQQDTMIEIAFNEQIPLKDMQLHESNPFITRSNSNSPEFPLQQNGKNGKQIDALAVKGCASEKNSLLQPPPLPSRPVDLAPFTRSAYPTTSVNNENHHSASDGEYRGYALPSPNQKQDSTSTVVESTNDAQAGHSDNTSISDANNTMNRENFVTAATQLSPEVTSDAHVSKRKWIGKWQLGRTIGEGSSGKVKLAHHVDTKETCVVKAVRRPKLANGMTANSREADYASPDSLEKIYKRELYMIREACLGMMLQHNNIVKLHSAVLGENHFYCFFELVEGEDLVDFISREGPLGESRSRDIFRKVISAIEYAHRNHVVHRDIKLENIRYNSKTGIVKILDFGFASFYTADNMLATNCGSPCYAAPEIYDNKAYDGHMVDVWSLGVCLFGMVTGTLPFDGPDFKSLAAKVRSGKVAYPSELSNDLIALLSGMFRTDPRKRASLSSVIHHPWVNASYNIPPLDYLESSKSSEPIIPLDWVRDVTNASVCQAGVMLMEALEQRIPARKIEEELPADGTDEDDSMDDAEAEASKFVSNMTIKDKKRSNIWWRRLFWGVISRHFGKRQERKEERLLEKQQQQLRMEEDLIVERTGGTIANFVDKLRSNRATPASNDAQIQYDDLMNQLQHQSTPKASRGRFRAFTNNVVNLFTLEKTAPSPKMHRHARWSPFKPR